MNEAVTDIFDRCLAQFATGTTMEECLVAHPEERAALEPLLRVATRLQVLPSRRTHSGTPTVPWRSLTSASPKTSSPRSPRPRPGW